MLDQFRVFFFFSCKWCLVVCEFLTLESDTLNKHLFYYLFTPPRGMIVFNNYVFNGHARTHFNTQVFNNYKIYSQERKTFNDTSEKVVIIERLLLQGYSFMSVKLIEIMNLIWWLLFENLNGNHLKGSCTSFLQINNFFWRND